MPTLMQGDFSQYPSPIKEMYPYFLGEVCELHSQWQVYHHLFMDNEVRTQQFGRYLGGVAGYYQSFLQDEMILTIGRLTDPDNFSQQNLGFPSLCKSCAQWDVALGHALTPKLVSLQTHVTAMRKHRHKRLAHYDLTTSLGISSLPTVTLGHIREAIEHMEQVIQLIAWRGDKTTFMFEALDHRDVSNVAETTIAKAAAYDALVDAGKIERYVWRNHVPR